MSLDEIARRVEAMPADAPYPAPESSFDHGNEDDFWEAAADAGQRYAEAKVRPDLAALLGVVRAVAELADGLENWPAVGATSEEQWQIDTEKQVARDLRAALAPVVGAQDAQEGRGGANGAAVGRGEPGKADGACGSDEGEGKA